FVRARLARNRRQRSLEEHAWIARGSSMPGPTLSVLQARIGELETILSGADWVRWRLLQAESPTGDGLLAERTRRRWVQDLACRYADRLI
ncbi:MAG TPA: hypothetical protein VFT74_15755, partial [Isosphaeraceae bacterium]|nr:hypothetical protein [Isosphaeraceae bacterium]